MNKINNRANYILNEAVSKLRDNPLPEYLNYGDAFLDGAEMGVDEPLAYDDEDLRIIDFLKDRVSAS